MRTAVFIAIMFSLGVVLGQTPPAALNPADDLVFVCPMDKDIRSVTAGKCSRCGMKLVSGIPEPVEYHLNLTVTPKAPKAQQKTHLTFDIHDPWKNNKVKRFTIIHEKLFHAFIISQDLKFFVHDHPVWMKDAFHYDVTFPQPGMYRILGDFYPEAATPQLITKTVFVPGPAPDPVVLARDYSPKDSENLKVELSTVPEQPLAGHNTQMHFKLSPAEGFEKYLGAWGHMLAASDDLIDMVHQHPFIADGSPNVQFNMVFPRARSYRVWVQFQRNGTVNTVQFDVPVKELGL